MKISPVLNRILPPLYRPRYSNYFRVTRTRRPRNDLIVAITRLYHREQYYARACATVSLLIRDT